MTDAGTAPNAIALRAEPAAVPFRVHGGALARGGASPAAAMALWEAEGDRMLAYARAHLPSADAEDAVHDAWARSIPRLDRAQNPSSYMWAAVRNGVAERFRRGGARLQPIDEAALGAISTAEPVVAGAIDAEVRHAVAAAMDQLSGDQREVFLMRVLGGVPFAEIADTLGCPINTALSHFRYARLKLRERLARFEPEHESRA
jgi:RNA polymerase sigma-70 factor (ECF subfamily)